MIIVKNHFSIYTLFHNHFVFFCFLLIVVENCTTLCSSVWWQQSCGASCEEGSTSRLQRWKWCMHCVCSRDSLAVCLYVLYYSMLPHKMKECV